MFWHPGYTISCYSRGLCSTKTLRESNRTPFSCNGQHTWFEIPVVMMEKLYPCSFKCLTSVAVMACMWLSPFLFFFYFSEVCFKQLVQFLWLIFLDFVDSIFLLAPHLKYIWPERCTCYCVQVWKIFKMFYNVLHAKSNRRLLKTAAIFLLNFVVKTALI